MTRARTITAAAVAAVLCGALSGCIAAVPPLESTSIPATGTATTTLPSPSASAGRDGTGAVGENEHEDPSPEESAAAPPGAVIQTGDAITPERAGQAQVTAADFVTAFVRKDLTGKEWEDGYLVYLTPYSQTAYPGTSQTVVPGTRITGSPMLDESAVNTTTSAVVTVPTDAGRYQVLLIAAGTGGWLIDWAIPPAAPGSSG